MTFATLDRPAVTSILDDALRLRGTAEAGPIGKRQSSAELYSVLAGCLRLVERCALNPGELEELRFACTETPWRVRQYPGERHRSYVERGSDAYIVVCRFVFGGLKSAAAERSNASRYAQALRMATRRGITSEGLAVHLWHSGGVNALFLSRPLEAKSVTTKCIRLDRPVTFPKHAAVTLTLRRMADGAFEVLGFTENAK